MLFRSRASGLSTEPGSAGRKTAGLRLHGAAASSHAGAAAFDASATTTRCRPRRARLRALRRHRERAAHGIAGCSGLSRTDAPFRVFWRAWRPRARTTTAPSARSVGLLALQGVINLPPISLSWSGTDRRRARPAAGSAATCDATTEIARRLARKGSFSSCVVLRALAAVAGRTTTALLLLLLLRFFVAFSLSICYVI